jgi:hypothetical protein
MPISLPVCFELPWGILYSSKLCQLDFSKVQMLVQKEMYNLLRRQAGVTAVSENNPVSNLPLKPLLRLAALRQKESRVVLQKA